MLSCTDGGFTGASLSRVSKSIRDLSSASRFHSVALCAGSAAQIKNFIAVFITQRDAATVPRKPRLAHLYISSPFSKVLQGGSGALGREEVKFAGQVGSLVRLVAPELETLCFVQCADAPNLTDFILPFPFPTSHEKSQSQSRSLCFPNLRELVLVGSGIACQHDCDQWDGDSEVFPRLTHLQLVATTMEVALWSSLAPNLTHMRVTDHDTYGARQVMRSALVRAMWGVLGRTAMSVPLPLPLTRAYEPETVYVIIVDGEPVRVLRCCEPRVVQAESDWEEVMMREWLERVGGGRGCWSVVESMA